MKNILLWIWQFPQNLIGFIISRKYLEKRYVKTNDNERVEVYFVNSLFDSGVSLGKYIIFDKIYLYTSGLGNEINHEHGHQKQSLYLGWFYFLIVGLPSLCNNLIDRIFHKGWCYGKRIDWYYNRFPEKQADKLGGVQR